MIPPIIHYCWFGKSKMPQLAKECIESWKKHNPEFQIMEWNESNSPISQFPFAKQAFENQKWAFVSDVIRLWALKTYGGIYLDTDVEVLKSFQNLLENNTIAGYEKDLNLLQTAVIGASPNSEWINDCLSIYENLSFSSERDIMSQLVNNRLLSKLVQDKGIILNHKFHNSDYITIYPSDYFCPMSYNSHLIEKTKNTYCIHYYSFSWSKPQTLKGYIRCAMINLLGEKRFRLTINLIRKFLHLC